MEITLGNRALTSTELNLARWMLEHGNSEASAFLHQLDLAEITSWKCPCGCASINFQIQGQPLPPPGVHILGEYLIGDGEQVSGVFIFESGGLLSGIEFYSLGGDALHVLPDPRELRTFENTLMPQTGQKQARSMKRDSPFRKPEAIYTASLLLWLLLVSVHFGWHLFLTQPSDELYSNSLAFQALAFSLTELPYWITWLVVILLVEFFALRRR